jgi:hypothetical protein
MPLWPAGTGGSPLINQRSSQKISEKGEASRPLTPNLGLLASGLVAARVFGPLAVLEFENPLLGG